MQNKESERRAREMRTEQWSGNAFQPRDKNTLGGVQVREDEDEGVGARNAL